MKILITGGLGGIGSVLGYSLFKMGHEVVLFDDLSNGSTENGIIDGESYGKVIFGDIRCPSFEECLKKEKVQYVIHLAAISSLPMCEQNFEECFSVNTWGTLFVLHAAKEAGVQKVIFSSTSAIYENNIIFPFTEDMNVSPTLNYSLSKKMAEDLCHSMSQKYNMNISILRYFNVFGPRQNPFRKSPPLINYLVREVLLDKSPVLHSDGLQERDYIHVDDVCRATYAAMISDKNGVYNVCSGKTLSVQSIFKIIKNTFNFKKDAIYSHSENLWKDYDISINKNIISKETNKYSLGDNSKIIRELGVSIDSNLESLIEKTAHEINKLYKF